MLQESIKGNSFMAIKYRIAWNFATFIPKKCNKYKYIDTKKTGQNATDTIHSIALVVCCCFLIRSRTQSNWMQQRNNHRMFCVIVLAAEKETESDCELVSECVSWMETWRKNHCNSGRYLVREIITCNLYPAVTIQFHEKYNFSEGTAVKKNTISQTT